VSVSSKETVTTEYWLWDEPVAAHAICGPPSGERLGAPAILQVRVWRSGTYEARTPQYVFVHGEAVGGAWPAAQQPEEFIPDPEEFAKLCGEEKIVLIGESTSRGSPTPGE
jgi:hypothetical protein